MLSRNLKTQMLLLVALLLVASVPVWSQAWAGRGRLQGTVKDESGKPMEGAKITLRKGTDRVDAATDGPPSLTTDKNGKWSTLGLAQGPWGILIEKDGFIPSEGQVQVNEFGPAQPINVVLKVIPKEVQEQAAAASGNAKAKAAFEQGNASLAASQWAQARAQFEEGLRLLEEPKDPTLQTSVLRAIADTYNKENNVDQAIATLKQALQIAPDDVASLQLISTLLVNQGKEKEAEVYIAKLPAGTKIDPTSILNVGIKAFNEGKMDEALAHFDRVVRENPDFADAYYYRALAFLNQDKKAQAKTDLQKLLQLDPNSKYAKDAQAMLKDL